jgi:hypothetical protein
VHLWGLSNSPDLKAAAKDAWKDDLREMHLSHVHTPAGLRDGIWSGSEASSTAMNAARLQQLALPSSVLSSAIWPSGHAADERVQKSALKSLGGADDFSASGVLGTKDHTNWVNSDTKFARGRFSDDVRAPCDSNDAGLCDAARAQPRVEVGAPSDDSWTHASSVQQRPQQEREDKEEREQGQEEERELVEERERKLVEEHEHELGDEQRELVDERNDLSHRTARTPPPPAFWGKSVATQQLADFDERQLQRARERNGAARKAATAVRMSVPDLSVSSIMLSAMGKDPLPYEERRLARSRPGVLQMMKSVWHGEGNVGAEWHKCDHDDIDCPPLELGGYAAREPYNHISGEYHPPEYPADTPRAHYRKRLDGKADVRDMDNDDIITPIRRNRLSEPEHPDGNFAAPDFTPHEGYNPENETGYPHLVRWSKAKWKEAAVADCGIYTDISIMIIYTDISTIYIPTRAC